MLMTDPWQTLLIYGMPWQCVPSLSGLLRVNKRESMALWHMTKCQVRYITSN